MNENEPVVRLYFVPQFFPCGEDSSCCGPVGQTDSEVHDYVKRLEKALPGVRIEALDCSQPLNLGRDGPVVRLLNSFGMSACPLFTCRGEVVSMGTPVVEELIEVLKTKVSAGSVSCEAKGGQS